MDSRQAISRRLVIRSMIGLGAATLLAACTPAAPAPAPTTAPAAPTAAPKPAAAATTAPAPTTAAAAAPATATAVPKPAAAPTTAPAAAAGDLTALKQVPRNKTWISVGVGGEAPQQFSDVTLQNPFLTGISRSGYQVVMEPLFYYNAYHTDAACGPAGIQCNNGEIPWLGTDYKFSPDFKQVTVNLRKGVEWSDGQPFTAKDVVFTVKMLVANAPKLA
jgi:ABC-type transport system substrate-binding protein